MERLIGYGYTNSSGVATMTKDANGNKISGYTGVGAGEMDFKARLHDDSSVQSAPYPVIDATTYDKGILNDPDTRNIWYNQQNTSMERKSEYTEITEGTGTGAMIYRTTSTYSVPISTCVEFDLYQVDGATNNNVITFQSLTGTKYSGSYSLSSLGLQSGTWNHIKLVLDSDGYVTPNNITAQKKELNFNNNEKVLFCFLGNGDVTQLRFKNWYSYPI